MHVDNGMCADLCVDRDNRKLSDVTPDPDFHVARQNCRRVYQGRGSPPEVLGPARHICAGLVVANGREKP